MIRNDDLCRNCEHFKKYLKNNNSCCSLIVLNIKSEWDNPQNISLSIFESNESLEEVFKREPLIIDFSIWLPENCPYYLEQVLKNKGNYKNV